MKEIQLENVTLLLSVETGNVRVKSIRENVILSNQKVDTVSEIIKHNFEVVSSHYKLMISETKDNFEFEDVSQVSIAVVMYYLYMYNSWRSIYKKQENKDLRFNEKDFDNPSTHDIVFNYFKTKYPCDWKEKCAVLLGMKEAELSAYYATRENFYNK